MSAPYFKYEIDASMGMISLAPNKAGILYDINNNSAIFPCLDTVRVFDLNNQQIKSEWKSFDSTITKVIELFSELKNSLAVGLQSGEIHILTKNGLEPTAILPGHRKAISAFCFCPKRQLLFSGSKDTNIIVWDIFDLKGVCKLKGHTNEVTELCLDDKFFYSASKDCTIKIWEVETMCCVQTLSQNFPEIWSLSIDYKRRLLLAGSNDNFIRIWTLYGESQHSNYPPFSSNSETNSISSIKYCPKNSIKIKDEKIKSEKLKGEKIKGEKNKEEKIGEKNKDEKICHYFGSIEHSFKRRILQIIFSTENFYLFSADNKFEVFKRLSDKEALRKIKRRKKRILEKNKDKKSENLMADDIIKNESEFKLDLNLNDKTDDKNKKKLKNGENFNKEKNTKNDLIKNSEKNILKNGDILPTDLYKKETVCICKGKITSASAGFDINDKNEKVLLALNNNSLAIFKSIKNGKNVEFSIFSKISKTGHRTAIRSVKISHDSSTIMTCSNDEIKIWDFNSKKCLKTLKTSSALSAIFLPQNIQNLSKNDQNLQKDNQNLPKNAKKAKNEQNITKNDKILTKKLTKKLKNSKNLSKNVEFAAIFTKSGFIEIFNLNTTELILSEKAHSDSILAVEIDFGGNVFITGASDGFVKFWRFEFNFKKNKGKLIENRRLEIGENINCIKLSPDKRKIAVGLLDSTIKVYHTDSLKFYISLYGHKLPVQSIDISSDSKLLISASADKNIKIWGLDFGDCHKSIFAHDNTVTKVSFLKNSYQFFSSGKDKKIKQWDAKNFEEIFTLEGGHSGEVLDFALSKKGDFLISVSADRSIRIWRDSGFEIFIDEERERKLQKQFDENEKKLRESQQIPTAIEGSGLKLTQKIEKIYNTTNDVQLLADKICSISSEIEEKINFYKVENNLQNSANFSQNNHFFAENLNSEILKIVKNSFVTLIEINSLYKIESSIALISYSNAKIVLKCLFIALLHNFSDLEKIIEIIISVVKLNEIQFLTDESSKVLLSKTNSIINRKMKKWSDIVAFNSAALSCIKFSNSSNKINENAENSENGDVIQNLSFFDQV